MVDHVKVGAVDGPSEAVIIKAKKDEYYYYCLRRRRKGTQTTAKFTIHPTCQIQILQLPEYEFHIMIFVDTLQLLSSDIGTRKLSILQNVHPPFVG